MKYTVKTCPETSEMLQKLLFKTGRSWSGRNMTVRDRDSGNLQFDSDKTNSINVYSDVDRNCPKSELISIDKAIEFIQSWMQKTIKAGDYEVTIAEDKKSVTANGIVITKETIEEIYRRMS